MKGDPDSIAKRGLTGAQAEHDMSQDSIEWTTEDEMVHPDGETQTNEGRALIVPSRTPASSVSAIERMSGAVSDVDPYHGVSSMPFGPESAAQAVLLQHQHVPDDWIDIKPSGQIYLSHMRLRQVFNTAFGFMGWGIVPIGEYQVERDGEHVTVYREYRCYVHGHFLGQAIGAGDYYTNNPESNYGDACEASQSYALNRFGKPFGIASQCWDKAYVEDWKAKYAETYIDRHGKERWRKKGTKSSDSSGRWVDTGRPVPGSYWEKRDVGELGGPGHAARKVGKAWHIFELEKAE